MVCVTGIDQNAPGRLARPVSHNREKRNSFRILMRQPRTKTVKMSPWECSGAIGSSKLCRRNFSSFRAGSDRIHGSTAETAAVASSLQGDCA